MFEKGKRQRWTRGLFVTGNRAGIVLCGYSTIEELYGSYCSVHRIGCTTSMLLRRIPKGPTAVCIVKSYECLQTWRLQRSRWTPGLNGAERLNINDLKRHLPIVRRSESRKRRAIIFLRCTEKEHIHFQRRQVIVAKGQSWLLRPIS